MSWFGMEANDPEIARTTRYIKDDKYIANVFGVSAERVRRVRLKDMERNKHKDKPLDGKIHMEPISFLKDEEHEKKMERGSTMLRNAVLTLILTRGSHAAS